MAKKSSKTIQTEELFHKYRCLTNGVEANRCYWKFAINWELETKGLFIVFIRISPKDLLEETNIFLRKKCKCVFCKTPPNDGFVTCKCRKARNGDIKFPFYKIDYKYLREFMILDSQETKSYRASFHSKARSERMKRAPGGNFLQPTYNKNKMKIDLCKYWLIQDGKCYFCGKSFGDAYDRKRFQIEHLQPMAKGGTKLPENIRLVCQQCNYSKYTTNEETFWKTLYGGKEKEMGRGGALRWIKNRKITATKITEAISEAWVVENGIVIRKYDYLPGRYPGTPKGVIEHFPLRIDSLPYVIYKSGKKES